MAPFTMKPQYHIAALAAVGAVVFSGCASHPKKLMQIKTDIAMPGYVVNTNALPFRPKDVNGEDKILFLAERARAYQITGDIDRSTEDYLAAEAAYDALDDRPVVALSSSVKGVKGIVGNDTALPYEGNAHERLMLYQLDAFNHLARCDWNVTRAAANNIVYLSEKVRARHEEEVKVAEESAQKDGRFKLSVLTSNEMFRSSYAASDSVVKSLTDAMQNGYAYYFGAFVKEVDGDYSNALLGYKRAAELAPANGFVKRDIARMESRLGTGAGAGASPAALEEPNVVVFFEEGFAPQLEAFSLSFATIPVGKHDSVGGGAVSAGGNGAVAAVPLPTAMPLTVKFALPYYPQEELGVPSHPLVVSEGADGVVAETQLVGDFRALAARAFQERLPYVATRAAFRAIAKATAAAVANYAVKDRSTLTRLAVMAGGMVLTQATEFADLRTWLLAPRFGQVARWHATPGEHKLTFQHEGNSMTVLADVPDNGTLVLHVMSIPGKIVVDGTAIDL